MKHANHSTPLRRARTALALLAALAAGSAAGQAAKPAPAQSSPAGPSYGPVLYPQPVRSEPGAQPERTPQAQEEKAGAVPGGQVLDPDPSARPAPQSTQPTQPQAGKNGKKTPKRSARRADPVRVDPVAVVPSAAPPLAPARPLRPDPGPAQINSCLGGTCTDTNGATYNTGVGNAAVNSQGRLCTRTANTMQCF